MVRTKRLCRKKNKAAKVLVFALFRPHKMRKKQGVGGQSNGKLQAKTIPSTRNMWLSAPFWRQLGSNYSFEGKNGI